MAIELNGLTPNTTNTATSRGRNDVASSSVSTGSAVSAESSTPASNSANVRLSPEAQTLQAAEASIQNLPEVDSQRVSDIRSAIEDGTFSIDNATLANNLLNFEESLF